MILDADAAYLALKARDARFDGRLFVGVTSTGIYCRPICRVRLPRRENCRFFETAAQAEAEAFRPCLKCRPEIAPGPGLAWSVMDASRTLARQAAGWIDAQAGAGPTLRLSAIAARLGIEADRLETSFSSDGQIALHAGYRAAFIGSVDEARLPANYHQPTDVPDNVDLRCVADCARLSEALARELAPAPVPAR